MLRGLALRQGLFALNGVLAFVLALVLILALREVFRGEFVTGPVSTPDLDHVAAPTLQGPARTASEYEALIARGLFGEAGSFKRGEKPVEVAAPPPTSTQETDLPLTLFGTTLSRGEREVSAAIIEVRDGGTKTGTYFPGNEVMQGVFLQEIRRQEVILKNTRSNTTESLKIVWMSSAASSGPANSGTIGRQAVAAAPAGSRANLVTLDREAFTKKLEDEYARVSSTLNVKVVNDESGRPKGITTDNIENFESAKELGFKNGDVLVSLNNEPVDSKERAIEVLKKYRSASLFRVGLLRDGQMQYKTFRVK